MQLGESAQVIIVDETWSFSGDSFIWFSFCIVARRLIIRYDPGTKLLFKADAAVSIL